MKRSNRTTSWLSLTSFFFAAFAAACGGGGGSGTGGHSGLGGTSGLGGAGSNVDSGMGGNDPDGGSPDVPTTGTTSVKLIVGPPSITLMEGSAETGKLSVALDRPYSQPITVTIVSANANVATAIPETVTFPENSITPQIVQVLAPVDEDTVPNATTLTVFSQETGSANVVVNVDDPDVQGLLATPPNLSMTEGRTESVGIRLAKRPASAVVVTLTSSAPSKLMLGTASLTFTAANYSVPQNVALAAAQDEDAMAEHVTIKATATGNIKDLTVNVEVIDDDAVNLDISPSSLSLIERGDMPGTIKVALTRAPSSDVTVAVASSNVGKVTVTPANLAFTVANFMVPQSVTVAAVPDDDARDDTATVTFSSPGIASRDVMVAIDDQDSQSIKVTPAMLTALEGKSTTFTVMLALKPDGDTTVNVFSQNPGKLQVVPPVLHFDATDFAVGKTVTVQALEDDDLAPDNVNITLIGSTAANVNVAVHIDENDIQALQLIPAGGGTSLVMQETRVGGSDSTSALGVRLAYRPSDLVTIVFTSSSDKLTTVPTSVTFVPSDFATPKIVTLIAKHDIDMLDDTMTLEAASSGLPSATLAVTVLDVDVQNLDLSGTPPTLALNEHFLPTPGFTMAPLKVKLNVQPPSNVTINFASNSPKVTVSAPTCVINGGAASGDAYLTGCTVQVAATPDNDGRDETATITVTASVAGVPLTPRTLPVTVDDTDTQALVVSATSVGPIDEGLTGTFTVGLKLNPVDPVSVSLFASDPAHFSVSPPTLTFSGTGTQTVTVTALNDDDMKSYTSDVMVQGGAAGATPAVVTVAVSGTNTDVQSVVLTPGPALTVLEGSTPQLGVRLAYRPVANETVGLASSDFMKLLVGGGASTAADFTPGNYATNQYVTLNAVKDPTLGSHDVYVTATSPTSPASTVDTVTITDIDTLNFVISQTSLGAITEGNTASFTVKLTATPATAVVPRITSSNTSVTVAVSGGGPCTLTTVADSCTVNVTAIEDLNALNEVATITVADALGATGVMRPIASGTVSASTTDNDMQALVVSDAGNTLMIHERNTAVGPALANNVATFTVKLQAQPAGDTRVDLLVNPAVSDGVTVSPAFLTFTAAEFGTAAGTKTVTVTGVPDNDLRTDPFSIRVTGPTLGVTDQFVNVSEIDDDTQSIVIRKFADCTKTGPEFPASPVTPIGSVAEGGAALKLCVSLKYQPLSNTVVDVATSPSILTVDLHALSFSTLDYDAPQTISFTAGSDNDANPEAGLVTLSSSGFAATRTVPITVSDPNTQAIVFTDAGSPVAEVHVAAGGSNGVKIQLAWNPVSTVNFTCGVVAGSGISISEGEFALTGGLASAPGSWASGKTITISATAGAMSGTAISCTAVGGTPVPDAASLTVLVP